MYRDTSENQILDYTFNRSATPPTQATHLAALTANPGDAGSLTEVQTPGANGYDREAISSSNLNAAASGSISNSADIVFGPATADWAAGATQVVALAAMSASTSGSATAILPLGTAVNVLNTQSLRFLGGTPGAIVASLD